MPRKVKYYPVSERELYSVGTMSAMGSLFTTLFGVAVGAVIAFGITLKTVDIPLGKTYTAIWIIFVVSLFGIFVFGGLSVLMCVRAFLEVRTIKQESEDRRKELLGL